MTDFKKIFGFPLSDPGTQRALYVVTVLCLGGAYLLCRWITLSRAGKVLVAIRDSEQRVLFSGYSPANYKLFVFVVSAALGGTGRHVVRTSSRDHYAGADRRPAVAGDGDLGRGRRARVIDRCDPRSCRRKLGPERLTNHFPDLWPFFLGGLFIAVVLMFPDGLVGLFRKLNDRCLPRRGIRRSSRPARRSRALHDRPGIDHLS